MSNDVAVTPWGQTSSYATSGDNVWILPYDCVNTLPDQAYYGSRPDPVAYRSRRVFADRGKWRPNDSGHKTPPCPLSVSTLPQIHPAPMSLRSRLPWLQRCQGAARERTSKRRKIRVWERGLA